MAKRNPEQPKLLLERTLNGFSPATPWDQETLAQYSIGSTVEAQIFQRRSLPRLRLYWTVLHDCVANSENKYGSAEDLHSAIKIALGYTHKVKLMGDGPGAVLLKALKFALTEIGRIAGSQPSLLGTLVQKALKVADQLDEHIGDTILMPGSIALDRMDEAEFKVFFDRAMNELRKAGYPVDALLEESEKKLARLQPYRGAYNNGRGKAPPLRDRGVKDEAA